MAQFLLQEISFPGIYAGVSDFTYYCAHGISPGKVVMTTMPQATAPEQAGTVLFTDGQNTVRLPDCRVDELLEEQSIAGRVWRLTISDRRWRWKTGSLWGRYNQYDAQNKLIPWTIRSPKELAEICLKEMGERNYVIDMPDGLSSSKIYDVGQDHLKPTEFDRYLQLGENFPQSGTNPPVTWEGQPPAVLLAELAERYGRRVVYQPIKDRVCVVPYGGNYSLNVNTPWLSNSAGIRNPKVPMGCGVWGAETLFQSRIELEPVGLDFGNVWVPIDELSYAPNIPREKLQVRVVVTNPEAEGHLIEITCDLFKNENNLEGNIIITGTTLADLAAQINAYVNVPPMSDILVATVVGNTLTITAVNTTIFFTVSFRYTGDKFPEGASGQVITGATTTTTRWKHCPPPLFNLVQATDRLSKLEAQQFARGSVWRAFRIKTKQLNNVPLKRGRAILPERFRKPPQRFTATARGMLATAAAGATAGADGQINTGNAPQQAPVSDLVQVFKDIGKVVKTAAQNYARAKKYTGVGLEIPGFGVVKRRFNVILTSQMVQQITPQPRDFGLFGQASERNNPPIAGGIMPDFYSGYSRSADARCYGEYATTIGSVYYVPADDTKTLNNPKYSRVRVPFTVLPDQQIILFSDYVYKWEKSGGEICYADPNIVYEGGVYVTDETNNTPVRFVRAEALQGGSGPVEFARRDDVIVNWIGEYGTTPDDFTKIINDREEDFGDGHRRAEYYLRGMLRRYLVPQAQAIQFVGIRTVDPDNAAHQVIWRFSPDGPTTLLAVNSEVSAITIPYADRRLAENLPPDEQARLLNLSENYGGPRGILKTTMQAISGNMLGNLARLIGG